MKRINVGIVGYRTQFDAFFEALERRVAMPLTGLKEAVLTHEVLFAADRSLQLGRPVKLEDIRPDNSTSPI